MLDATKLAEEINKAIGASDCNGKKIKVTEEMKTYAKAVLTIMQATTAHLPGTVTGVTAPGAPLANGAASNGMIVGLSPGPWQGVMSAGFAKSNPGALSKEATASTGYISGAAKINFAAGNIVGTCTNVGPPSPAPGPLAAGAGTDGTIDSLDGTAWAQVVMPPLGNPALAAKIYKAIVKYVNENAEVTYAPGSVVGVCPPGGGPLSAGAATGGVIS